MATNSQIMAPDTAQTRAAAEWFAKREGHIQRLCPPGVAAAYIMQAAIMAVRRSPSLVACEPASIVTATLESAYVGFPVNTSQQLAFFVPYGRECQFQLGWRGLVQLATAGSERVSHVYAHAVFPGDLFEVTLGTSAGITHEPTDKDRADDSRATFVYAVVQFKGGGYDFEVMTRDQVEAIRAKSPSKSSPAWKDHWGEMARKTCIKRLLKRVGVSPRVDQIIEVDNRRAMGERVHVSDAIPVSADVATDLPETTDPLRETVETAATQAADDAGDDLGLTADQLKARRKAAEALTR